MCRRPKVLLAIARNIEKLQLTERIAFTGHILFSTSCQNSK
jgi:hypothetical protein